MTTDSRAFVYQHYPTPKKNLCRIKDQVMDTIKEFESLYRAGLQMQDCVKRRKDQTKKKITRRKYI